jgi:hypothetical protein
MRRFKPLAWTTGFLVVILAAPSRVVAGPVLGLDAGTSFSPHGYGVLLGYEWDDGCDVHVAVAILQGSNTLGTFTASSTAGDGATPDVEPPFPDRGDNHEGDIVCDGTKACALNGVVMPSEGQ